MDLILLQVPKETDFTLACKENIKTLLKRETHKTIIVTFDDKVHDELVKFQNECALSQDEVPYLFVVLDQYEFYQDGVNGSLSEQIIQQSKNGNRVVLISPPEELMGLLIEPISEVSDKIVKPWVITNYTYVNSGLPESDNLDKDDLISQLFFRIKELESQQKETNEMMAKLSGYVLKIKDKVTC